MKRLFALLCAAVPAFSFPAEIPVFAADSAETFGENIVWNLDADTLYLSGTGATDCGFIKPKQPPGLPISPETLDEWENEKWSGICGQVKHIVIGEGITVIETQAFSFFPELETVSLPDSLEKINFLAFAFCPQLKELINVPETAAITGDAFTYDAALCNAEKPLLILNGCRLVAYGGTEETDITVPEQVTYIGANTFAYHPELKTVHLPDGLQELGEDAFCDCTGLTEIDIPETVTQIKARTFMNCTALRTAKLPNSLSGIAERAFAGCSALQFMEIPASVQSIGDNAFQDNPWFAASGDYVVLGDGIFCRFQGRQKIVTLPKQAKHISKDAVSGNQIVEIQIPETVTEIESGAICCKYAVIAGTAGSAAEHYAAANNMPFRDLNAAAPQGDDRTVDYAKDGWYFGNSGAVFGSEYFLTDTDRQRLTDLGIETKGVERKWIGSCVGLALTVILAKDGYFHPAMLQNGARTVSEIEPSDAVRSFINYYQCTQGRDGSVTGASDFQKIYRMSLHLPNVKHGESPFLLTFALETGSHGVAAYGLESGEWRFHGKAYDRRVLVWDSNFPDALHDDSCLYFDSQTLDYCIPYYGVHVADGANDNTAGLIDARNDLSVLNAYPYPLPEGIHGDLNFDGSVTIADAVLLCRHLTAQASLKDYACSAADLSGDRTVDAADLTLLKQAILQAV